MMIWLTKILYRYRHLPVAVDVGCGKSINHSCFPNKTYIGADVNETFLEKARERYPMDTFQYADISRQIPPSGDIVVCTLVLHNKHYPADKTIQGVKNLTAAVNVNGVLIFTTSDANTPYEASITPFLAEQFRDVKKHIYGRFNHPSYFSIPLAWLMYIFPPLRIDKNNRMILYECTAKRQS
jgi:predicted TPR repeat methyltransferase